MNTLLTGATSRKPSEPVAVFTRRAVMRTPVALLCANAYGSDESQATDKRWIEAAEAMRQQALSWGDQAYGAVLVKDNRIIGYGPSRVVKNNDPQAHAEREAIKHALASAGALAVRGAILYSTSRPCGACEAAAAKAGIHRMVFGQGAHDAGSPQGG